MSDTPPSAPPRPDPEIPAPPAGEDAGQLEALRREIDRCDIAILEQLDTRSRILERIHQVKSRSGTSPSPLRPGREADILRALLRRPGRIPPASLAFLWRHIISMFYRIQGDIRVAVVTGSGEHLVSDHDIARSHYGPDITVQVVRRPVTAISGLAAGDISIALLPLPEPGQPAGDTLPWWAGPDLRKGTIHVVAVLPLIRPAGWNGRELFLLSASPPEPSGDDCSLLVLGLGSDVSSSRVRDAMDAAGMKASRLADAPAQGQSATGDSERLGLFSVRGNLIRNTSWREAIEKRLPDLHSASVIGLYATPLVTAGTEIRRPE